MHIPFIALEKQYHLIKDEAIDAFHSIGESGQYILGEYVEKFESEIAKYLNVNFVLGVANGSDALFLTLKALNIKDGDEVITCSNSFIASAWVIAATGATTKFVDVGCDLNMDIKKIEKCITAKTKAIIPVHLTGNPADMTEILMLADKYNLYVIEDAAQAFGAEYRNKKVGSIGDAAGFSMHPLKNLGVMGDGGIFTSSNKELFDKVKKLRNHGLINRDECEVWGYNSRLDNIQAAIASIKLKYIDKWNERHRDIAALYKDALSQFVITPENISHKVPVYHNFIIQTEFREKLINFLNENGIETKIHYPIPIHLQECAKDLNYKLGDLLNTEKLSETILSLPIYAEMSNSQVEYVIEKIISFFRRKI